MELAARMARSFPPDPDTGALNAFLRQRKSADPVHYPDFSLSVLKLMGQANTCLRARATPGEGHFGLAAHDYTHSTAPNRRFADLVTQRLVKAVLDKRPAPYSDERTRCHRAATAH